MVKLAEFYPGDNVNVYGVLEYFLTECWQLVIGVVNAITVVNRIQRMIQSNVRN